MKKLALFLTIILSSSSFASSVLDELNAFGQALEKSTDNSAIRYKKAIQTTQTPLNAYKLTFSTNSKSLMSQPNAKEDPALFMANQARTEVWQRKFCNVSLRPIFKKYRINMISGDLTNTQGVTQSLAICMESELHGDPLVKNKSPAQSGTLGSWYDDVGSPSFMDATFTIYSDSDRYFIKRKNGDESEGKYPATKSGNKYIKIGDKHGAYYVITDQGLNIYDKNGYIRTAKKIK